MSSLDPHVAHILDTRRSPSLDSDSEDAILSSLESDLSLAPFREARLQELHTQLSIQKTLRAEGYGTYSTLDNEKALMDLTTSTKMCVVHFFKDGFQRCAVMDGHLEKLADSHLSTRFVRIAAPSAPFLCTKLSIKVLPCVLAFMDGMSVDRIVGFEGLGYTEDTFTTKDLETRLLGSGVLVRATAGDQYGYGERDRGRKEEDKDLGDDDDWD